MKKSTRRPKGAKPGVKRRRVQATQKSTKGRKSVRSQKFCKNDPKSKSKGSKKLKVQNSRDRQSTTCSSISLAASTEYLCYSPKRKHHCWALTSLKAPYYESSTRANVDIVAVIDKSGSMRGEKISLVKETLLFIIDQLKDNDRLSLVMYDSNVELVFGLIKMNEMNKERAREYVAGIRYGTTTNLFGGLRKGMEQIALTDGTEKSQVQSVLLLTDGLANCGITSTTEIVRLMKVMQDEGLAAVSKSCSSSFSPWGFSFGTNPQSLQQGSAMRYQVQSQRQVRLPPPMRRGPASQPPPRRQGPARQHRVVRRPVRRAMPRQSSQHPVRKSLRLQQQKKSSPQKPKQKMSSPQKPKQATGSQQKSKHLSWKTPLHTPLSSPATKSTPGSSSFTHQPSKCQSSVDDTPTSSCKFDGTVYTFGFGSDHDASMLEAISTQGGGMYYYIDSNEKIPETFADCLGGLLSVIGQNVSVKLESQGGTILKKVHTSKTIKWTTPNKICDVAMGDIQSEESRDLVLELELPSLPLGRPSKNSVLVDVQLSYFNVISSKEESVECQLITNRIDGDGGQGNMTVDIQRNRVLAANALKKAEELGDNNKLTEAKKVLKDAIASLNVSLSKEEGLIKLLLLDLNKCLDSLSTRDTYKSHGKNYMCSRHQTHSVQRTNFVYGGIGKKLEAFGYGSVSKKAYRLKSKAKK